MPQLAHFKGATGNCVCAAGLPSESQLTRSTEAMCALVATEAAASTTSSTSTAAANTTAGLIASASTAAAT